MAVLKSFAVFATIVTLAAATPLQQLAVTCYPGPLVIYARGTDNTSKNQDQNDPNPVDPALVKLATAAIPNATIQALEYPASAGDSVADYKTSWGVGIDHLQSNITTYVDHCPGHKVVLLGYSQGASVITGAVGGGQGRTPLASKYLPAIAGGVAFADPSFVHGLAPLDAGNNTSKDGYFQDGNVQKVVNAELGTVFRSFCQAGDEFCASAFPFGHDIHSKEQQTYMKPAVKFLQSLKL